MNKHGQKQSTTVLSSSPIRNTVLLFLFMVGILSIIATAHTPGPTPSSVQDTFVSISLGNRKNFISIAEPVFLGHRVERFKLRVRFNNPDRESHWLPGVTLAFRNLGTSFEEHTELPSTANADGSFWTGFIPGNRVWIMIFGRGAGIVDFDGGQPQFEILGVERYFDSAISRQNVPSTDVNSPQVLHITRGFEAIGYSPVGGTEAQHFVISTWSYDTQVIGLYISPLLPSMWNDIGVSLAVSNSGFKSLSDSTGWVSPAARDTGIYTEFVVPATTTYMFVTVKTTLSAPYFFSFQLVDTIFRDIVMERDEEINTPAGTNTQALINKTSNDFPYGKQLADFLQESPTIDQRIRELVVLASAHMLNASDGMFRIGGVKSHTDIDFFRDVDVQFNKGSGRAEDVGSHFDLYEVEELDNPLDGAWTFHHEWSHYEYDMPDEYIDVNEPPPAQTNSEAIDPNSLMGTKDSNEFCHRRNHRWSEETDAEEESMWDLLVEQYEVSPAQDAGGLNHGQYMDVLNKLKKSIKYEVNGNVW